MKWLELRIQFLGLFCLWPIVYDLSSVTYDLWHRQKCPFLSGKKWDFERPNLRTDSKNPAKHPPKWLVRHLFHAFIIFGRVFGQFWKIAFLAPFWSHFPHRKPSHFFHSFLLRPSSFGHGMMPERENASFCSHSQGNDYWTKISFQHRSIHSVIISS